MYQLVGKVKEKRNDSMEAFLMSLKRRGIVVPKYLKMKIVEEGKIEIAIFSGENGVHLFDGKVVRAVNLKREINQRSLKVFEFPQGTLKCFDKYGRVNEGHPFFFDLDFIRKIFFTEKKLGEIDLEGNLVMTDYRLKEKVTPYFVRVEEDPRRGFEGEKIFFYKTAWNNGGIVNTRLELLNMDNSVSSYLDSWVKVKGNFFLRKIEGKLSLCELKHDEEKDCLFFENHEISQIFNFCFQLHHMGGARFCAWHSKGKMRVFEIN